MNLKRFSLKNKLLQNFSYSLFFQVLNLLVPIIAIPHVIKSIGIDRFGIVSYSLSIVLLLGSIVEYGFNISATREIAEIKDDKRLVSEVISSVIFSKLFLSICVGVIYCVAIFSIEKLRQEYLLHLISYSIVIGNVFVPSWYFQAFEKFKLLTILNGLSKVLYFGLIFFLIDTPQNSSLVNLSLGLSNFVLGGAGLAHIFLIDKVDITLGVSQNKIRNQLKSGWHFFLSSFSINIYSYSSTIILGSVTTNPTIVGFYSVAEKLYFFLKQPLLIFVQVIYPRMFDYTRRSYQELRKFIFKSISIFGALYFIICSLFFVLARQVILFYTKGTINDEILLVFKMLCFLPVLVLLFNSGPYLILIFLHKENYNSRILMKSIVLNLVVSFILSFYFSMYGTATALICTELYVGVSLMFALNKAEKDTIIQKTII